MSKLIALFVVSNGKVTNKDSLHYHNPADPYAAPNQYMQAITAVGNVLAPFDKENRIPVWAFVRWSIVTAIPHQVKTKTFSPQSRCVPTYGSYQTRLCIKVRPEVRNVKCIKLHTQANSEFHLGMKQLKFDVPYFWLYFVAKSNIEQSVRRYTYAPWVWRKDFGFHLVMFRCVSRCNINCFQDSISSLVLPEEGCDGFSIHKHSESFKLIHD